ncbi:MAG: L-lactate dehydrogenase [Peptoniphilaceae bacterium]|nr:L-lactate dehydrogenase [Peptoniphilaceae bacterium]MDY6018505.1 L-lactate dehydrogenase [Anaerococcus sp.]
MKKISIIGLGNVGSTVAYSLIERKLCEKIALFDKKDGLSKAEVNDLMDGMVRRDGHVEVIEGRKKDLDDTDIIIFAPGDIKIIQENQDLMSELTYTKTCVEEWAEKIKKSKFRGIIIVVSNPCDVLSSYMQELTGFAKEKVIGTGTILDTARMKNAVSKYLDVDPSSIDGYVLGEHGYSQFVAWSQVNIATKPIKELLDKKTITSIEKSTKTMAFETISAKGYTSFGIANATAIMVETIFTDAKTVLPVSSYSKTDGCYIGHPAVLGASGVIRDFHISLNEEEEKKWQESVKTIKQANEKRSLA